MRRVGAGRGGGGADMGLGWLAAGGYRRRGASEVEASPPWPPQRLGINATMFRRHGSLLTGQVDLDIPGHRS